MSFRFVYRAPRAVPYWNPVTYRRILQSVLLNRIVHGPSLLHLRSLIIEALNVENAFLCGSGSLALEIALRACGVSPGDEVIIPTFCCTSVVPPVISVGAVPVLADIGEELNVTAETVEAVLSKKTKAVIVPHLFGNPVDIPAIIELAVAKDIRIIDDAAQALGATVNSEHVGTFGNAGILSFGSEKVCFGIGGGVVISRDQTIFERCTRIHLTSPQRSRLLRNLFSTVIRRRWRRWTRGVQMVLSRIKPTSPDSPPEPYRLEKMANLSAAVAHSLVDTLTENIAARRLRVRAYQELLGSHDRLKLVSHRSGSACLSQVVRVLSRRSDDLATHAIEALNDAGYEVQGSYIPIHLLQRYEHLARKPLRFAERVWADLIELPCEPSVSFEDLERIAGIVKDVVKN